MGQAHHTGTTWAAGTALTAARLILLESQYSTWFANSRAPQVATFYDNAGGSRGAGAETATTWTEESDPDNVYSVSGATIVLPGAGLYSLWLRRSWLDFGVNDKTGYSRLQLLNGTDLKMWLAERGIKNMNGYNFGYLVTCSFYVDSTMTSPNIKEITGQTNSASESMRSGADYSWCHLVRWTRA